MITVTSLVAVPTVYRKVRESVEPGVLEGIAGKVTTAPEPVRVTPVAVEC